MRNIVIILALLILPYCLLMFGIVPEEVRGRIGVSFIWRMLD